MDFDETPYLRIAAARLFLGSGCRAGVARLSRPIRYRRNTMHGAFK
jgi:hypothetical protein